MLDESDEYDEVEDVIELIDEVDEDEVDDMVLMMLERLLHYDNEMIDELDNIKVVGQVLHIIQHYHDDEVEHDEYDEHMILRILNHEIDENENVVVYHENVVGMHDEEHEYDMYFFQILLYVHHIIELDDVDDDETDDVMQHIIDEDEVEIDDNDINEQ